ncbi:MAG: tRNA pseudouridine(55) synthase TruB [Pseudomonadota bacterium]
MARRKRGRDVHGWLIVDKPVGPTSSDVVNMCRRALDAKKAGHAGTLDPLASGLLAIAFGEATKTIPLVQEGAKTYRFGVRLGQATTTDDAEGAVLAESAARPSDDEIRAALPAFTGAIMQVPPAFSAVKIDGTRAYDLARAALDDPEALPELRARPLTVERLVLLERPDPDHAVLEMICGKGGYVRSIARDLGRVLGCGAHVSALRRLASGTMTLKRAFSFAPGEKIGQEAASAHLLPVATGLDDIPALAVSGEEADRLRRGMVLEPADFPPDWAEGATGWAAEERAGEVLPVAIGTRTGLQFRPGRVFNL